MTPLPRSTDSFIRLVQERLQHTSTTTFGFRTNGDLQRISAVLFLLGKAANGDPVLILNKRSRLVRQPGDLCCPGGGVSPTFDSLLSKGLSLPAAPLARWPHGRWWRRHRPREYPKLSLLLATALREGFEEMRLNPLGVDFLGPMPAQQLVMFKRAIYPLVAWVRRQRRFIPNWEVDKIVRIPMASFFNDRNYARYRISFQTGGTGKPAPSDREMPCFVHRHNGEYELLWGATFRITTTFLTSIFGYEPPAMASLPVIHRRLDRRYLKGSLLQRGRQ